MRTAVYRVHNADGELLYVGMTRNPRARFHNHAAGKPGAELPARPTVEEDEA